MTGRAVWVGAISFGLVNIQVKLYAATEEHDISFCQVHTHGDRPPGQIKYKRICSVCQEEVAYADISKGYKVGKDIDVVLTKEEIATIPLETLSVIELQEFVPASVIDPILFERTYTLTPDIPDKVRGRSAGMRAAKAYGMLTKALERSGKVGIAKVTLRQREQMTMLGVRDGRMSLTTLRWADEIREMPEASYPKVSEDELELAGTFINSLSADHLGWSKYRDDYQVALESMINAKRDGVTTQTVSRPEVVAIDLMEALKASLLRAKQQKVSV